MLYSEKVMDHFMNPRNVGVIEDADGIEGIAALFQCLCCFSRRFQQIGKHHNLLFFLLLSDKEHNNPESPCNHLQHR